MPALARWPFVAPRPRKPSIGQRGHARLSALFSCGVAALQRMFWPSPQELEEWLQDRDPFP